MATAKQTAKTLTVGTSAVVFDPAVDLGPDAGAMHSHLLVKNRSALTIGVHQAGGTASIDGDDVEHLDPGESLLVDVTTLSIVASGPGAKVEIAGERGRVRAGWR